MGESLRVEITVGLNDYRKPVFHLWVRDEDGTLVASVFGPHHR